jgi:hypothetical protein
VLKALDTESVIVYYIAWLQDNLFDSIAKRMTLFEDSYVSNNYEEFNAS